MHPRPSEAAPKLAAGLPFGLRWDQPATPRGAAGSPQQQPGGHASGGQQSGGQFGSRMPPPLVSMTVDTLPHISMSVNMCLVKLIGTIEECCAPVLQAPLSGDEAGQLASALRVLADPARLRIVSLIAARPDGEACVCHLTEPLGLSQPTVSHHLKILHEAGLLGRDQRGRWVHYRILPERLAVLRDAFAPGSARHDAPAGQQAPGSPEPPPEPRTASPGRPPSTAFAVPRILR
jgi:ArsR family transcriptional regulator